MLKYFGFISAIGFISLAKDYQTSECAAASSTEGE